MFSFFKRFKGSKTSDTVPQEAPAEQEQVAAEVAPAPVPAPAPVVAPAAPAAAPVTPTASTPVAPAAPSSAPVTPAAPVDRAVSQAQAAPAPAPAAEQSWPAAAFAAPTAQQSPQPVAQSAPSVSATLAAEPEADEETVEIVPPPAPEPAAKRSWLTRLKTGLSKTSSSLTGIFVGAKIDEDLYEELETALLMSDAGVDATEFLLESLREKVRAERLTDPQQVKTALRSLLIDLLKPLEKSLMLGRAQPLVMMIAGVNGAGKTTSIGKLAKHLQRFDQSVLLAAGDTFRAAAREQLAIWGERNNVTVVAQESGDPAAVIFDAVGAARARKIDVLMADTAGRLPTQLHLMEELRKVKRVVGKALDGAPHEVLLVIDANTGQNALAQVKAFDDALGLTGLIVTKLDGTAKGGILAAIARQRPVPVYFIGIGEKVEDLQPFSAEEFSDALLDF
ncbi:signal recognition particle-docking protein FtsY [Paraburkholderia sp. GAS42]|jgi:fused signal recognition particle receptor|uniref:signal recognition particle-docking protein FtsY n=1 Tax=Paraburkholderia sp. GAS42 TaxID=3035135 RepID=UPI003D2228F5